jgi:hypothetical protein
MSETATTFGSSAAEHYGLTAGVRGMDVYEMAARAAKRDEFACAAITGMLHNGFVPRQYLDDKPAEGPPPLRDYAIIAYRIADAMLEARATP